VPTVAEAAGLPGYRASTWYALFAPARVPDATLNTLHRAATAALKSPSVSSKLAVYGGEAIGSSPQELRDFMASEIAVWSNIIKVANIRPGA
jgi:tripartite-type tricarboxylate transporter receptor subunit TctC